MWIVLDLIVVGIVLFFLITSAKKGFARTLVELVGFFLAIYLSTFLGSLLADALYKNTVEPKIVETVKISVEENADSSIDTAVDNIWNELPKVITNSSSHFGIQADSVKKNISDKLSANVDIETIAKDTAENTLRPIFVSVVKSVISIILFAIFMFFVRILARIVNKIFKLPVIGGINTLLGAILGVGKGLIVAFAVCMLISFIVPISSGGFWIFTKANIDKTYIFKLISNIKLINF